MSRITILIVDDEESFRHGVQKQIEDCFEGRGRQLSILQAGDGWEAEQIVRRRSTQKIDLIISDVSMPICSGPELYENIRDMRDRDQIVFWFMTVQDDFKHECPCFLKPIARARIKAALAELFKIYPAL